MGDGATGATITLTQTNPDYPMSLCGIRVYGTLDPRALLDKEYLDYKYDIKYEEDRKEKQTEEQAELDQTIEDLETDYFSVDDDAEVLLQKQYVMWDLVDNEYLWKDRCYFTFLGVSLFCFNDDEWIDQFSKYEDSSINMDLED